MPKYRVNVPINLGPGGHEPDPFSQARLKLQIRAVIGSTDFNETTHTSNACLSLFDVGDQVGICYMYCEQPEIKGVVLLCSWKQAHEGLDLFRESARQSNSIDMLVNIDELADEIRQRNKSVAEMN